MSVRTRQFPSGDRRHQPIRCSLLLSLPGDRQPV